MTAYLLSGTLTAAQVWPEPMLVAINAVQAANSCPGVAGADFHVPDFVLIAEDDPAVFGAALLFNDLAQALDAFFSGVDVRQDHVQHGSFRDPVLD